MPNIERITITNPRSVVTQRIAVTDPRAIRRVEVAANSIVGFGTYMQHSVYDPAGIENDAFDLAYHYGVLDNAAAEIDGGLI